MKLTTTNYTVLKSLNGESDVIIKPNTPFEPFMGDYINTSFARIFNNETKELVLELNAGQKVKSIGNLITKKKLTEMPIAQVREILAGKNIEFPSDADKRALIKILGF